MSWGKSEDGHARLIRIDPDGGEIVHVGMGVAVSSHHVLTCAHVANECLRRGTYSVESPGESDPVQISFPLLGDTEHIEGHVVSWSPPGIGGLDCAVIELETPVPEEVGLALFSVAESDRYSDHRLSIFASLGIGHPGAHTDAKLMGEVGAQWSQLNVEGRFGVQPGYSGGSIWNRDLRASVGIIVARQVESAGTVAYFLSARRISEEFEGLVPLEIRRAPERRQAWFGAFSILLLVLVTIHLLAMRSPSIREFVPLAQEDPLLAGLWGALVFCFPLGPWVYWAAAWHARSFAFRPWYQKVPPILTRSASASLGNSRLGALGGMLFLLLPLAGQGFFLHQVFLQEAPAIFVDARNFPEIEAVRDRLGPGDPRFHRCDAPDLGEPLSWCLHDEVSVWSVLPLPPYFDLSPYFDDVYRIRGQSDNCPDDCERITFFPILQPFLIFAVSIASFCLFLAFLYAVWRPLPFSLKHSKNRMF